MSDKIKLDLDRGRIVTAGPTTHDIGSIKQLEDGLWYYQQGGGRLLGAWVLREIADLLDEANREWNEELDKAMSQQPEKP